MVGKRPFGKKKWTKISLQLNKSSAFIFVVPEYGGMATPQSKNFFFRLHRELVNVLVTVLKI